MFIPSGDIGDVTGQIVTQSKYIRHKRTTIIICLEDILLDKI